MSVSYSTVGELHNVADRLAENPDEARRLQLVATSICRSYGPFTRLLAQLRTGLLEARWKDVVVDNRSARLPSRALQSVADRLESDHSIPAPAFHHIAAGRRATDVAVCAQLENLPPLGDKTLFFSEYFAHGGALVKFAQAAERQNVPFDAAALVKDKPTAFYAGRISGLHSGDVNIYAGQSYAADEYYNPLMRGISGVTIHGTGASISLEETPPPENFQTISGLALNALADALYTEHFARLSVHQRSNVIQ